MLNIGSVVRMTASYAERAFVTHPTITVATLTEQHLDMLQMTELSMAALCALGLASDEIRAGRRGNACVKCVIEFNARCGRR